MASPEVVRTGGTLTRLIEHQIEVGVVTGNADEIAERILALIARGKPSNEIRTLTDGRVISVHSQPMEGGGWVATHQDVTEQQHAERETERAGRIHVRHRRTAAASRKAEGAITSKARLEFAS